MEFSLNLAPASALDFADALTDAGERSPGMRRRRFGRIARMVEGGPAITLRTASGELLLIAGIYRGEEHHEAWFAPGPALAANLLASLRIARRLLEMTMADEPRDQVRCFIARNSVAGARLAAWFGFTDRGVEDTPIGPLEVWSWKRRQPCRRSL